MPHTPLTHVFCKDCKHYQVEKNQIAARIHQVAAFCGHAHVHEVDLVTGYVRKCCANERQDRHGACGPEGKLYEPQEGGICVATPATAAIEASQSMLAKIMADSPFFENRHGITDDDLRQAHKELKTRLSWDQCLERQHMWVRIYNVAKHSKHSKYSKTKGA